MDRPYRNLPLNPLRAFAVASRHRTFTAAAQHMGVSQVAISRQIAILENWLEVKLFERGSRSVKLTEAGRAFGHEIAGLFDQLEAATARMLADEGRDTVNLRLYPSFAHHWLLPRLKGFTDAHPEVRIRLDTKVEPLDFRGAHLDAALQLGHGAWRDARARKLFDEVVDVVCAPAYLARFGGALTLADLPRAELLHSKYRRQEWELWAREAGVEIDPHAGTEFESSLLTYSACRQGFGLAVGQLDLLEAELAAGELVRPFDRPWRTGAAFWVAWPTMTSAAASTRRFVDWLLTTAGEAPEFFPGAARKAAGA
ncbi:LysR substrate-binding domain-containing protein [Albimonas sp. CAU 1670]|uniref:LysR substrate-binding domain-containing protein n=1 Tax=Albimonas sp. CAU 1670 TaxID=3032599 RepID=UPI0023DA1B06|nr:LysR substrate-binding domain-containing protein [Albimonas sp. CAU 1670]MDF2233741.1 LysR substrate-binding domain-containing protein [Albimonas sp. CAU 1670]